MVDIDFGIISAVPNELRFLKKICSNICSKQINGIDYLLAEIEGKQVAMIAGGIGTVCTAAVATHLMCAIKPKALFFIGTAGAISNELNLGDVVVGTRAFEVEIQDLIPAFSNTPFEEGLRHSFKHEIQPVQFDSDPDLLSRVNHLLQLDNPFKIVTGVLASTNCFISYPEQQAALKSSEAIAIDMESSALYQVGWLFNIPTLAVRGISNPQNASGDPSDDLVDLEVAESNSAQVLASIITL